MLAPSTKYNYATISFWGLAKTKNISQFNWYEYVLQAPYTSTRKMQKIVVARTNPFGVWYPLSFCTWNYLCFHQIRHILIKFTQLFLLDNLDQAVRFSEIMLFFFTFPARWKFYSNCDGPSGTGSFMTLLICVAGVRYRQQLAGNNMLYHELSCILVRG
jgi:hypothetical protein